MITDRPMRQSGMQGRHIILLLSAVLLISACQPPEGEPLSTFQQIRSQRLAQFSDCGRGSASNFASLLAQSHCMEFLVPENPAQPRGRQIPLKILLVPALSAEPEADPLVFLAGGPGQAATELLQVAQLFGRIRRNRDILLVDQRGTGELSPLQCDFSQDDPLALEIDLEELMLLQETELRECLEQLDARPEFYTTDIAIQDLEAIRQYLGYSQYNLIGGSYGSRVALAYLQAWPEHSRTVIIDGIAPPAISLPLYIPRDASSALSRIFADCAAQSTCNEAFPDLQAHFGDLLLRLETPQTFSVYDAAENRDIEVSLNRDLFLALLRQALYTRETQRLIPLIIEQAYSGNYSPLTASLVLSDMSISQTMFLSVVCNEDVPLITDTDWQEETGNDYLFAADILTVPIIEACRIWPRRELPGDYFEPVSVDNPVLIFSGSLDPVTPPLWGELVARTLPGSRHIIVDGYAHGTFGTRCTLGLISDFVASADLTDLDAQCVEAYRRRPFFTTAGGSQTAND